MTTGSLSVAAGARMRGRAEFGWNETGNARPVERLETPPTLEVEPESPDDEDQDER